MTTDMVADLEKSLNDKKKEHENLMNTSTSSMWTSDLETIKTAITEKTKTKNKK
jgi:L-asparaginase/Glu-tRNA(Gln) amidotransferase subunit D